MAESESGENQGIKKTDKPVPPVEHQFKPGVSGNPAGKPKGPNITTLYKKVLGMKIKAVDPETGETRVMTLAEVAVIATVKQATLGSIKSMKEITDRTEGKVPDKFEHTGAEGAPLAPLQIMVRGVDGGEKP